MKYGYFDDKNREYVIERPDIPVSWTNYLGLNDLVAVISHNAGGYSWYKSTEHGRITRFRPNGVPLDRPGYYIYLRDDQTGEYWSVTWDPVQKDLKKAVYLIRHGLSYSRFECEYNKIHAEKILFIPIDDNVLLWDVKIKNTSKRSRVISVFNYLEWSNQHVNIDNQDFQMSLYASGSNFKDDIIEFDFFYEPWNYNFLASNFKADSYDCVRDKFIGVYHTESNPVAVQKGVCSNSSELGGNHCGSLHKKLNLKPGEEARLVYIMGIGSRQEAGYAIKEKYSDPDNVDKALEILKENWREKWSTFQVKTPHPGINSMLNVWNLYQAEVCSRLSRFGSFIEVGGRNGIGFRDSAQDILGVLHTNPHKAKQRIEELLHAETREGYGLHLFDPIIFKPENEKPVSIKLPTVVPSLKKKNAIHGLEDTCADDALWLVPAVCEWVMETGEVDFFDKIIPYVNGCEGTVYEHLAKILDFSAQYVGKSGICLGLRADWNDVLNLGGGESAMVSFLHYWALNYYIETAEYLGRHNDVIKYCMLKEKVKNACNKVLWDGDWYLRGITKSGSKVGSVENEEGKIFLNTQSWAVYSGVAENERAIHAMDSVYTHLYSKYGIHLLGPAYSRPDDDIGFITRVYRGIKENGSIFTHSNTWAVIAETILGRGDRAMEYYDTILPYNQNDSIEIRESEPYAYCQFIMGKDHKNHGRARHPWLTGTAAWFYMAATKFILGIRPGYYGLNINPCIPATWMRFEVIRKWRGATYHIKVENPDHVMSGVRSVSLNGQPIKLPVPIQKYGTEHTVCVNMG
jgi:N,N'-diacetylchitobiose phosphorylase